MRFFRRFHNTIGGWWFDLKQMSLLKRFNMMMFMLIVMFVVIIVVASTTLYFFQMNNAWENIGEFDFVSRSTFTEQLRGNLSKMKTIALVSDICRDSPEDLKKIVTEYSKSENVPCAVVARDGKTLASSSPVFGDRVHVLDVSPTQAVTIREPEQENGVFFIPVYIPLHSGAGFLVLRWKPEILSSKAVFSTNLPWISACVASRNGLVIDGNIFPAGKNLGWRYEDQSKGKIGEYFVYTSKIVIPEAESYWWYLSIVSPEKLRSGVFSEIVWVFILFPLAFVIVFMYVQSIRRYISSDLSLLVRIIKEWYRKGVVNISASKGAQSLEIKQLGKMLSQVSHKISEHMEEVQQEASLDKLVRLPNHATMEKFIVEATKNNAPFSIFFIDLDGFKPINDNYGHKTGDLVLKAVAEKLKESFRDGDIVSRWGGDEFVVFIRHGSYGAEFGEEDFGALPLISRLRQNLGSIDVDSLAYAAEGIRTAKSLRVSASVGVSSYPGDAVDATELISIADARMYEDKATRSAGRKESR